MSEVSESISCYVYEGLCNRLNGIASALASGRRVDLHWAVNGHCPVRYEDLLRPVPGLLVENEDMELYRRIAEPNRLCWFYPRNVLRLHPAEFRERLLGAYRNLLDAMRPFEYSAPRGPALAIVYRHHLPEVEGLTPFLEKFRRVCVSRRPVSVHVASDSEEHKVRILEGLGSEGLTLTKNSCPLLGEDLPRSRENVFGMCRDLLSMRLCGLGLVCNNTRSTVPDSLKAFGVTAFYTYDDGFHRHGGRDEMFEQEPVEAVCGKIG